MKYLEIHPYYRDSAAAASRLTAIPSNEFYKPAQPAVIRLDTIRSMRPESTDGTISIVRLHVSEAYEDDILITKEEAETIKKTLLKDNGDALATEVAHLTVAVRELWNLLRARMH